MSQVATIKISSRGNVPLPREFRNAIGSDVVRVEIDGHKVTLSPANLGTEDRERAAKELREIIAHGYHFKHEKFNREELYDRYERSVHCRESSNNT